MVHVKLLPNSIRNFLFFFNLRFEPYPDGIEAKVISENGKEIKYDFKRKDELDNSKVVRETLF
jgi:hypothetical protein